jgi:hypothetical protein
MDPRKRYIWGNISKFHCRANPRFIVFIWGPEGEVWIRENNSGVAHSLNRICSGSTEIKRWIRENSYPVTIERGCTVQKFGLNQNNCSYRWREDLNAAAHFMPSVVQVRNVFIYTFECIFTFFSLLYCTNLWKQTFESVQFIFEYSVYH